MIRIMVVEDDVMYRFAVRTIIDWSLYGCRIESEAINGRHALQLMEKEAPDVLLTDVSMPEMNGIELIKAVKGLYPQVKIVVLSSYDDFNFVKDALKFGAEDYILKHELTPGDIVKVIEQVKIKINEDREKEIKSRVIRNNLPEIADSFIKRLLTGEVKAMDEIKESMYSLDLKISLAKLVVLVIKLEAGEEDRPWGPDLNAVDRGNEEEKSIRGIMEEAVCNYREGLTAKLENSRFAALVSFEGEKSEAKIKAEVFAIASRIKDSIHTKAKYLSSIGISDICEHMDSISLYYTQCEIALQSRLYEGTGKIFHYNPAKRCKTEEYFIDPALADRLSDAVKNAGPEAISRELDTFFADLYKRRLHGLDLKKALFELFSIAYFIAKERQLEFKEMAGAKYAPLELLDEIESIEKMKNYFLQLFLQLNERVTADRMPYKREIQKVIHYINENYMNNITLAQIAAEHSFSPNYLCNLFKQETGLRIVEYINKVRIEEAKKLLRSTDLKVYEIAGRVGFSNTSYFCTVFKDITGAKVTDFKRLP